MPMEYERSISPSSCSNRYGSIGDAIIRFFLIYLNLGGLGPSLKRNQRVCHCSTDEQAVRFQTLLRNLLRTDRKSPTNQIGIPDQLNICFICSDHRFRQCCSTVAQEQFQVEGFKGSCILTPLFLFWWQNLNLKAWPNRYLIFDHFGFPLQLSRPDPMKPNHSYQMNQFFSEAVTLVVPVTLKNCLSTKGLISLRVNVIGS